VFPTDAAAPDLGARGALGHQQRLGGVGCLSPGSALSITRDTGDRPVDDGGHLHSRIRHARSRADSRAASHALHRRHGSLRTLLPGLTSRSLSSAGDVGGVVCGPGGPGRLGQDDHGRPVALTIAVALAIGIGIGIGRTLGLRPDAGPRDSRLDPDDVTEIRDWLHVIASTRVGEVLVEKMSDAMLPDLRRQLIELSEAVEMQANSVQSLADRAKAEAEQPMSKLASNARSGRYGQGAPTTSWLTFASTGGVLDSLVAGEKPRVSDGRKKPQRDAAAKTVFEGVRGAIEVGFSQAVVTLQGEIDKSWREDMVNTEEYRDEAAKRIDTSEITKDVVEQWLEDLAKAVAAVAENPWFTREGTAALLGSAAGGVNGAEKALRTVGLGEALRPARESLAVRLEDGISRVVDAYTSVLDEIPVGNGRQLRLRASEYRDRV